jgi:alpha-mannosidase
VDTASLRAGYVEEAERAYKDQVEGGRAMGAGVGQDTTTGIESPSSVSRLSDRAFLIFNPLPYPRSEVVEAVLWDCELDPEQLVVTGGGLDPRPMQVLEDGRFWAHTFRKVAFPVEVPALGYCTVCVSDRLTELGLANDEVKDPWAGMLGSARQIQPPDYGLENEALKAWLDPASGGLTSLLDKRTGREWVPEDGESGFFQYCVEANQGMTAWVIGQFMTREDLLDGGVLSKVQDGPYIKTYRWTRKVSESTIELDVTVRQGMPRVAYRLRVDWREIGSREGGTPHLRIRFPLALRGRPQPRYEIPFGSIRRDLLDGEEVPAQRWADLSEAGGAGVTLVNSSKYGFSVEGSALDMTLLRASIDPDPLPDLGEHIIEWALVPHGEGWTVGQGTRAGEEMNVPLVVLSCGIHEGDLPAMTSFLHVEGDNVRLGTVKESQDGTGIILRLVEVEGRETEARVTLSPALLSEGMTAVAVDTLERPLDGGTVRLSGNVLSVKLPAYGIVSVFLRQGDGG